MKKKIAVSLLKPGISFSEPVYIEGENVFVAAGVPMRQKDLDRLNAWGIAEVETEGEAGVPPAEAQPPAKKTGMQLSIAEVKENSGAYRTYMRIIEHLDAVFIAIGGNIPQDAHAVDTICTQILQGVREQRESFIDFILGGEVDGREMAKSSVNTAILSALIAQELKLPPHKIMKVVTGALLHDAGMLRLPREILEKRGGLSDIERQKIKSHPVLAHRIATREFSYPDEIGNIVIDHHERWDGGGYPRRIKGEEIDLGARIVSVADAFEAMVSQKSYRNSMAGYEAMKNLLADNSRRFDPSVLKAFILIMGIYPIGSIVQLNNGVLARVVEVRGNAPLRPKIQVLIEESNADSGAETEHIIDLLVEKTLYITKAVGFKEAARQNE